MKYKVGITGLVFFYSFLLKAQQESFKSFEENKLDSTGKWSYHFQLTTVYQMHPAFNALYSGAKSLKSNQEEALSLTSTLFFGRKLWKNASFYFNPEVAGGNGLSGVNGMGGVFNGEIYRVGNPTPTPYVARCYLQQHFAIDGSREKEQIHDDVNQVKEDIPSSRITISAGKFSLPDFFDHNLYAHDPRTKFLNWSLMSGSAWDYPANVRGYTWGFVAELIKPTWEMRFSSALVPLVANGAWLDWNYPKAHSETFEIEKKIRINNHTGKIRLLVFRTISRAVSYRDAINGMKNGDSSLVSIITGEKVGNNFDGLKYGFSINFDQEISNDIGIFGRTSWNDGKTSIWAFTDVDESVSFGINIKGKKWNRSHDEFGLGIVVEGLSDDHRAYLNAGGNTFMLGDGKLTNYASEQIIETYYSLNLTSSLWISFDYQFAMNPGYNKDRGPVNVLGFRTHIEF